MTHDAGHRHHAPEPDDELEPRLTPDHPRQVSAEDLLRFEGYLSEILASMGLDLDTPGTRSTPRRFLRALFDTTSGYEGDPKLLTAFPTECRGGASVDDELEFGRLLDRQIGGLRPFQDAIDVVGGPPN